MKINESAYERIREIRDLMQARAYMAHELTPRWMEHTRRYMQQLEKRDILRIAIIRASYKDSRG